MNRQHAVLLLAATLVTAPRIAHAAADEIHWTLTGPTSVTFDWRGAGKTLRYGLTSSYGATVTAQTPSPVPFSSAGPFWEAPIAGLETDQLYHYSIDGGPDRTFRTMPAPGSTFSIFVEGDVGSSSSYSNVPKVQKLIAEGDPRFVLVVGDLTYGNDHGQVAVDSHFNDVMVWSEQAAYMPTWGNHEWTKSTDDLRNYKGRFDLPNQQASPGAPSAGGNGEDWYWFDCARVRFIAVPEPYSGAFADWNTHAKALMDEAQADPDIHFIVTFGHRPPYSTGHHGGDSKLQGYMDALGDAHSKYVLDLNGHCHNYERSHPQHGVTHVTVGTGGSSLEIESGSCPYTVCPQPSWSAVRAVHHGALLLTFTDTSIRGDLVCGPSDAKNDVACPVGDFLDSFTLGTAAAPVDRAPVVSVPATKKGPAGRKMTLSVTAADPDGDAITSLTADLSRLPAGHDARFIAGSGNQSGTLTWTPDRLITGLYAITFHVANQLSASASTEVEVEPEDTRGPVGPPIASFELGQVASDPGSSTLHVDYSLATAEEASIELVDVSGRVVHRQSLGSPGPGHHEARLDGGAAFRSGVLWLRLTQGSQRLSSPVVIIH